MQDCNAATYQRTADCRQSQLSRFTVCVVAVVLIDKHFEESVKSAVRLSSGHERLASPVDSLTLIASGRQSHVALTSFANCHQSVRRVHAALF